MRTSVKFISTVHQKSWRKKYEHLINAREGDKIKDVKHLKCKNSIFNQHN